uniref:RRM domain-containing protein n=1 Tax=Rhabditophanes sp. KR3021 TaxID=114890 RepID=A0AC35UH37_9BILA
MSGYPFPPPKMESNLNRMNAPQQSRQFFTPKPQEEQRPCFFAVGEVLDSPTTKVFIAGITKAVTDNTLSLIFGLCGTIFHWKWSPGADEQRQSFAFCEFDDCKASIRALRLFNDFKLGEKCLIVKMDEKVKTEIVSYYKKSLKPDCPDPHKLAADGLPIFSDDEKDHAEILEKAATIIKVHQPELLEMELLAFEEKPKESKEISQPISDESDDNEKVPEKKSRSSKENRTRAESISSTSEDDNKAGSNARNESFRNGHSVSNRRDAGDTEDEYVRRKIRQKVKLIENDYQDRKKHWESRERKMSKEYKFNEKKEIERKAKNLKEYKRRLTFHEDYDDEKCDERYYSKSQMIKIREAVETERERDKRDQLREHAELEEMKKKAIELEDEKESNKNMESEPISPIAEDTSEAMVCDDNMDEDNADDSNKSKDNVDNCEVKVAAISVNLNVGGHRVHSNTFGINDDEEEGTQMEIKKKLKIFTVTHEERMKTMSEDERVKIINSIVQSIPKDKDELYATPVDWESCNEVIIKTKVRGWIETKVTEYLGEKEDELTDFITQQVLERKSPQMILKDVKMVLDEDAETFTIKLWRLLIYEAEAKKRGIC